MRAHTFSILTLITHNTGHDSSTHTQHMEEKLDLTCCNNMNLRTMLSDLCSRDSSLGARDCSLAPFLVPPFFLFF